MNIQELSDTADSVREIAGWYFDEWSHFNPGLKRSDIVESLQSHLHDDGLPQMLVALDGQVPIGVAEIKFRELSLYPQLEHWLGGVFVKPEYRGMLVGCELVKQALKVAQTHSVVELYLQTLRLDGGLYSRLGWQPVEEFQHKGHAKLLMVYRF